MKKNKGFTLIELLAVIVVLAIIALIATPIVMNTIKNAKKGAAERSGESYTKQVELTIATEELNKKYVEDGTYNINSDGDICLNVACDDKLVIEMSGTKPSGGKVKIEKGQVSTTGTSMKIGDYTVSYDTTKKTYVATEKGGNNVEVLCTKADGVDLSNLTYGNEFTCELGDGENKTFYMLEESGDNVSLIMNMNIDSNGKGTTSGNIVAWSADGDNSNGPVTALTYLSSSTKSWTKLKEDQISLPSGEQIATAGGDTEWSNSYYTENRLSSWLYENLNDSSAPYGYWTSTPIASSSGVAWFVYYGGLLNRYNVDHDGSYGVRPVITLSKAQLG